MLTPCKTSTPAAKQPASSRADYKRCLRALNPNFPARGEVTVQGWYLQLKWYGSAAEVIAFGRECVTSKEWKDRVPLILWEAHRMLADDRASGLQDKH